MMNNYEAPFAEFKEIVTTDVILSSAETHTAPSEESQTGQNLPEDEF